MMPHHERKANASAPQRQSTTVTINHEGDVYLAGERLDVSQLAPRLKELGATAQPVIIRTDSSTDYRRFVEVVDACKAASVRLTAMTAQ